MHAARRGSAEFIQIAAVRQYHNVISRHRAYATARLLYSTTQQITTHTTLSYMPLKRQSSC